MISVTALQGLLAFQRPINEHDASFVPEVFGLSAHPHIRALVSTCDPILVTAPATQGKMTLLYWLRNKLREHCEPGFGQIWISPPSDHFASRQALADFIALCLHAPPGASHLHELISASDIVKRQREGGSAIALFIDASRCTNWDALWWLVHSTYLISQEYYNNTFDARVLVILSGNYEPSMFISGPTSMYAFRQIQLRNLTRGEVEQVFDRVTIAGRRYGGVIFKSGVTDALFGYTNGDKYFVNWLGAAIIGLAAEACPMGPVLVEQLHVHDIVCRIQRGSLCDATILPNIGRLVIDSPPVAHELRKLLAYGGAYWPFISARVRQSLFQVGAVAAVKMEFDTTNCFKVVGNAPALYSVRNPILVNYLEGLLKDPNRPVPGKEALTGAVSGSLASESAVQLALLRAVRPGREDAREYERVMVGLLTFLFSPPLVDPHAQVRSFDQREVLDITFYNDAKRGFWNDMKLRHNALVVVVEVKNSKRVGNNAYQQISDRLGEARGGFALLITRKKRSRDIELAKRRLLHQGKVVIALDDEDITKMLVERGAGRDPAQCLMSMYRSLVERA